MQDDRSKQCGTKSEHKEDKSIEQNSEISRPVTVNHLPVEEVWESTCLGSMETAGRDGSKELKNNINKGPTSLGHTQPYLCGPNKKNKDRPENQMRNIQKQCF